MTSKYSRLDRFISLKANIKRKAVRLLLAQKRIQVDGELATCTQQLIGPFNQVRLDEQVFQDRKPIYLMLNKPQGYVSATRDTQHNTVLDLIDNALIDNLHIAGRLDLNSTGLILLTNDGKWSQSIIQADNKVTKQYRVSVRDSICDECIKAFQQGIYFAYEGITTKPASLERLGANSAIIKLREGRYHQIKRMFGRFRNPVLSIHRVSIGQLNLDKELLSGEYRALTDKEVLSLKGISNN